MKKTFYFRSIAAKILCFLILTGILAPSVLVNRVSAVSAREAYRNTVRDLVSLYGICESGKMNTDEDARGIISVVCADMFGDSTEELFVARLDATTVPSGDMGPTDAICTIYVFNDNQYSNESCVERTEGAYLSINGVRSGDRFLLTHSPTRMISSGKLWDGDSWVYKSSLEDRTPEEQAWSDEEARIHGDGGWRHAELSLLYKRCGFTEEPQSVFSISGQGEILTAMNGNYYTPEECVALLYDSVPENLDSTTPEPVPDAPKVDTSSNMPLDYNKISSIKDCDDLTYYLEQAILSTEEAPNDAAVNELILYAESAISNFCTEKMRTFGNSITLGLRFRSLLEKARKAKNAVEELFYMQSIPLNNPIDIVVPVLWKNCNIEKDCNIYTKDYTYDLLQDTELRLYLGDSRHYLQFTPENTDLSFYGDSAYFAFRKLENNTYSIRVMCDDEPNNLPANIGVGLPADTETATVMANFESGAENIGCQYDAISKLVFFETSTYGVYEVVDNYVSIGDISHLSTESQKAIQFLVSKNYMSLTNGNFHPEDGLNRYQFTQAIVGMFFALNNSRTTTFSDVPSSHTYYSYVASGQAENIVEGFDDNTFRGDDAMPMQQMLALASRTLVNKKGYAYPSDPTAILEHAYIDGKVDGWAKEAVAMALRDGLWDFEDTLYPQMTITREQAAVVLYRLFLLLQEVSSIELNTATNIVLTVAAVVATVAIVVCIVLTVILIKKNNEISKRKKRNTR